MIDDHHVVDNERIGQRVPHTTEKLRPIFDNAARRHHNEIGERGGSHYGGVAAEEDRFKKLTVERE